MQITDFTYLKTCWENGKFVILVVYIMNIHSLKLQLNMLSIHKSYLWCSTLKKLHMMAILSFTFILLQHFLSFKMRCYKLNTAKFLLFSLCFAACFHLFLENTSANSRQVLFSLVGWKKTCLDCFNITGDLYENELIQNTIYISEPFFLGSLSKHSQTERWPFFLFLRANCTCDLIKQNESDVGNIDL